MQSDKLCISKSLVRNLENFTPHLGPAMCVAILTLTFTIIKLFIRYLTNLLPVQIDTSQLDSNH